MGVERAHPDVRQSVHRGGPGKPATTFGRLQDYVVYTGVLGVVEVGLGGLALTGLAGALLSRNDAERASSVVVVLISMLGLFVLLVANRAEWRRRIDVDRRLLRNYCDTLEKRHGQQWRVKSWVQEVDVRPHGDVFERISVTVVECEFLDFCSIINGSKWDWPDRYRPRVKVKVCSVEVGYEGGARFDYTSTWMSRHRPRQSSTSTNRHRAAARSASWWTSNSLRSAPRSWRATVPKSSSWRSAGHLRSGSTRWYYPPTTGCASTNRFELGSQRLHTG
jgi:hypothetical protein